MTSVVLETDRVIIGILRSRDQPREGGIGDEFLRSHLTSVLKNDAGWGGGLQGRVECFQGEERAGQKAERLEAERLEAGRSPVLHPSPSSLSQHLAQDPALHKPHKKFKIWRNSLGRVLASLQVTPTFCPGNTNLSHG